MTASSHRAAKIEHPAASVGGDTDADRHLTMDAKAQQLFLAETLDDPKPVDRVNLPPRRWAEHWVVVAAHFSALCAVLWRRRSTLGKTAAALLAALFLVWTPAQRLMTSTSAQAIVNARIVTVRASIDGVVAARLPALAMGASVEAGAALLEIENPVADSAALNGLRQTRAQLATALAVLEAKRRFLANRVESITSQMQSFRAGRIAQLEMRISALDADLVAAKVSHATMAGALQRIRSLSAKGIASQAKLDATVNEESAARQLIERLSRQKDGLGVELRAVRAGVFIGDSYNDVPQSAQRLQEDELQLIGIDAQRASARVDLADLDRQVGAETQRHAMLASATLRSAVSGRVWEVLVAPGELVSRGQDVLRLVDCASSTVTAAVSESVYQYLAIGQRAQFRPRTGEPASQGWITGLSGLASVNSNSAIHQSALSKEPYKVTLRFPNLDRAAHCLVGRSGLVTFDTSSPADGGHPARATSH